MAYSVGGYVPGGNFKLRFPEEIDENYQCTVQFTPIEVDNAAEDLLGFNAGDVAVEGINAAGRGIWGYVKAGGRAGVEFVSDLIPGGSGDEGQAAETEAGETDDNTTEGEEELVLLDEDGNRVILLEEGAEITGRLNTIKRFQRDPKPKPDAGTVTLYLPQAFQLNEGVLYENIDMGIIGAAAANKLQDSKSVIGAIGAATAQGAEGLISTLKGSAGGEFGALVGQRLAGKVPIIDEEKLRAGLSSATRTAINPNTRNLFKNVNLRSFTFTFTLVPNSPTEARAIDEIVAFFRTELYPEEIGTDPSLSLGFRYPNLMDIQILHEDTNRIITKILPCFIRDVQVVYNQNAAAMHAGPYPNAAFSDVQITVNVTEYRPLNKNDVLNEYGIDPERGATNYSHPDGLARSTITAETLSDVAPVEEVVRVAEQALASVEADAQPSIRARAGNAVSRIPWPRGRDNEQGGPQ